MHTQSRANAMFRCGSFLTLVLLCALPSRAASPKDAFLDAKWENFEAKGENDFIAACRMLNKGCGIEMAHPNDLAATPKTAQQRRAKVSPREILDEHVRKNPAYKWVLREEVVNMEPAKRDGEDVLSRKLDSVSIHGVTGFKAALDVLYQAKIPGGYEIMGRPPRFALLDLELKNVTVREALNAIAKADGKIIWIFRQSDVGGRGMLNMLSWRKSGATFSKEEAAKVKRLNSKPQ